MRTPKLFAFDTEDDGQANFIQGGVFDGSRFWRFESREDMGQFMAETRGRFYTFNLEYDLVSLFWPDLVNVQFWRSNGRILSARVGVAQLFDLVWGMGGVGMAFCARLIGKKKGELDARSWKYLQNDLELTWAVLERLKEELAHFGIERVTGTLAGSSLRVFKSMGGEVAEFPAAMEGIARAAYYGGRTECFDFRERTVHGFDVNSMFPAAMLEDDFPAGRYTSTRSIDMADFVEAEVRVGDLHVPVLPCRDQRLIFPVGRFRGTWAGEEIRYAIEHGRVKVLRLFSAWRARSRLRPFDVFCSTLFERRRHDDFSNYYCKRIMNSLYGKMGQRGGLELATGPLCAPVIRELSLPTRDYNPAWPATITARARVRLHRDLIKAGNELVYCDTDSIFCGSRVAGRFQTGDGLGELKLEHEHARMRVRSPKLYRITKDGKTKYRSRGVPGENSRTGLNPAQDFFELGAACYSKPLRLVEAVRRKLTPNVWTELEKHFGADGFEKRKRLPDGRTEPLRVN